MYINFILCVRPAAVQVRNTMATNVRIYWCRASVSCWHCHCCDEMNYRRNNAKRSGNNRSKH